VSDRFNPLSTERLVSWIGDELIVQGSILGIPRELFFRPSGSDPFALRWHGRELETPIGVAAGPHTQLTGNIIAAWLCGARVIELKTVQILDQIDVKKPCIDMQDEGYNIEWSQELSLQQSFEEYLRAWVMVHTLHSHLGFPADQPGLLFDVSVGYDLKGIKQGNMQRFLDRCIDVTEDLNRIVPTVAAVFPDAASIEIPRQMAGGVTLSTMHGCPAEEIGIIATHLMEQWGLNTTIKVNPTLLGPEEVEFILRDQLGFNDVTVPPEAFEHDPGFGEVVQIVDDLQRVADHCGVTFAVKVSNTLEVINHRDAFDIEETRMYLSGRPLHALGVRVAGRLSNAFKGRLPISFAGGADAFNTPNLLAAGLCPVTSCSDLLRPGGYLRLRQYIQNIREALELVGATDLDDLILKTAGFPPSIRSSGPRILEAARQNLSLYADSVLFDPALTRERFDRARTKTTRELGAFDCIAAPCTDGCAVRQNVPAYMRRVKIGDIDGAASVINQDNPLPSILGRACDHPCESPCLRTHLDDPLAIRDIKRYVTDNASQSPPAKSQDDDQTRVAIVGAGPCGLAAADFLMRAGFGVTIFEARPESGGMVSGTIPGFRASSRVVDQDLQRITAAGAEILHGMSVGADLTIAELRDRGYRHIVAAAGAQIGRRLGIDGEDAAGVWDGLVFLRAARSGQLMTLNGRVGVIGGGDVAVDCARTANRLGADHVEIIYRRSVAEMPAQREEIESLSYEGIPIREVTVPQAIVTNDDRISGLKAKNSMLGAPDSSGRQRPIIMWGSDHEIPLDALVIAIGQEADLSLFEGEPVEVNASGFVEVDPNSLETSVPGLFAGGDLAGSGPSTIVKACSDGRRIAEAIATREGSSITQIEPTKPPVDMVDIMRRRSHREYRVPPPHTPADPRSTFEETVATYPAQAAQAEASRCLDCDLVCSTCDSVCPNRAIFTYQLNDFKFHLPVLQWRDDEVQIIQQERFALDQSYQVAVLADLCNECGNCSTFCPTAGQPHLDKPRLFLDAKEFAAQKGNAFRISHENGSWKVQGVFNLCRHELVVDDVLSYRSPTVALKIDPATFEVIEAHPRDGRPPSEPVSLAECAMLFALFRGVRESVPWIPTAVPENGDQDR